MKRFSIPDFQGTFKHMDALRNSVVQSLKMILSPLQLFFSIDVLDACIPRQILTMVVRIELLKSYLVCSGIKERYCIK